MLRLSGLCSAALLFAACANYNLPAGQRAVVDSPYFGTDMLGGQVTEKDWQQFLAKVITPRFPRDVTSWVAAGQWQNHDGSLTRERSHVVLIVHDDLPQSYKSIGEIVSTYKERFRQEAVLRIRNPARISF